MENPRVVAINYELLKPDRQAPLPFYASRNTDNAERFNTDFIKHANHIFILHQSICIRHIVIRRPFNWSITCASNNPEDSHLIQWWFLFCPFFFCTLVSNSNEVELFCVLDVIKPEIGRHKINRYLFFGSSRWFYLN